MDTDYIKQQIEEIEGKIAESSKLLEDPEFSEMAKQEIEELEKQKQELVASATTPMESNESEESYESEDVNPNIANIEIRSAAGGDEAGLFAGDLFRMYSRFAQSKGWKIEELDRSEG